MTPRFSLLVCVGMFAFLVSGCSPGKSDIEKSIKEEMKKTNNVEITSVSLTKKDDGSYDGTATAANGDVYDVTTAAPSGVKIEWKALPGEPMVERLVREDIEAKFKVIVKRFNLTKHEPGNYTGVVETDGGKIKVKTHMEGANLLWELEPAK